MTTSAVLREQYRALGLCTLAFTLCFAVWTLFSVLGLQIRNEFSLSDTQLGLLMATPVLSGSLSRSFLGLLSDRYGGRWVFGILMLFSALCVCLLTVADSFPLLLLAALGTGLAGGSFIVGTAYVARWFEPARQGTALGIFGAGNVGAGLTNLVAPLLLLSLGWRDTALVYAAVLAVMGGLFMLMARNEPHSATGQQRRASFAEQLAPLAEPRVWRFSLYYFFVFGAFVALALWLPHYLMQVYGLSLAQAGLVAALYSVPAALFRILGGWLADRYGSRRVMYASLGLSVICTLLLSYPPTRYIVSGVHGEIEFAMHMGLTGFVLVIMLLGFFMSLGMAAVFKHIPAYYPQHVGVVGGLVGMVGGLGGFCLPLTFGMLNDVIGIWQSCFMLLLLIAAGALAWMHYSIRMAERLEWAQDTQQHDLPELATPDSSRADRHVLQDWRPEDPRFWADKGKRIATRNLWISIACLVLAFAIWMVWSVVVAKLPLAGFNYSANQLFWLAALPALSGATLRIFYSFMVPVFGGRRWTALSTASLLLPALWIGFAVQNPQTPYLVMLILALLCGLGGGNFSSSMANISFFFPKQAKGSAMGLNAGLGNLGVSLMQFAVPLALTAAVFGSLGGAPQITTQGTPLWLQNAGFIWVPFIIAASLAAWFGMHDIASARASFKDQMAIFKRPHTWLMSVLYTGTFGSFIGFSAGFPLLAGRLFPEVDVLRFAFLGPLVGAVSRAFSGGLADRFGGGRITLWVFAAMALCVGGVLYFIGIKDQPGAFWGFLAMFLLLFFFSGVGNASTTQMIPAIFRQQTPGFFPQLPSAQQALQGERESAAAVGFIAAVAAYGGFFIPKSFGSSFDLSGGPEWALYGFIAFYLLCIALTWFNYTRRNARVRC